MIYINKNKMQKNEKTLKNMLTFKKIHSIIQNVPRFVGIKSTLKSKQ